MPEPALFDQLARLQEFLRRLPAHATQAERDEGGQVTSSLSPPTQLEARGGQEVRGFDGPTRVID